MSYLTSFPFFKHWPWILNQTRNLCTSWTWASLWFLPYSSNPQHSKDASRQVPRLFPSAPVLWLCQRRQRISWPLKATQQDDFNNRTWQEKLPLQSTLKDTVALAAGEIWCVYQSSLLCLPTRTRHPATSRQWTQRWRVGCQAWLLLFLWSWTQTCDAEPSRSWSLGPCTAPVKRPSAPPALWCTGSGWTRSARLSNTAGGQHVCPSWKCPTSPRCCWQTAWPVRSWQVPNFWIHRWQKQDPTLRCRTPNLSDTGSTSSVHQVTYSIFCYCVVSRWWELSPFSSYSHLYPKAPQKIAWKKYNISIIEEERAQFPHIHSGRWD